MASSGCIYQSNSNQIRMELFVKSIEKLTKKIQEDNNLDSLSFDLIQLLNLTENEIQQIQKEVSGIELVHLDEFWDLTENIYKILMLKTIKPKLSDFFKNLQETYPSSHIEIEYYFSHWDSFLLSMKNSSFKKETPLETKHAENEIQKLLDLFQIKDHSWLDELYNFDYKFNFKSEIEERFHQIAFSCWQTTKTETNSNSTGSIIEINGGSYLYDLDTGNKKK